MNDELKYDPPGRIEMWKSFERAATNNIQVCLNYTRNTRKLLRELENEIKRFNNMALNMKKQIDDVEKRMAIIQGKLDKVTK